MDASRFDRLSKIMAGAGSRRILGQTFAALAVAGIPALQAGQTEAKQRGKRSEVGAEHFRHKKKTYCLNGETIRRYRRKQEKLLAMGATLGKCGDVPCVPTTCQALGPICGEAADGCGGTLQCGDCDIDLTCCSGVCVNLESDDTNCGVCGNVCSALLDCLLGVCSPV